MPDAMSMNNLAVGLALGSAAERDRRDDADKARDRRDYFAAKGRVAGQRKREQMMREGKRVPALRDPERPAHMRNKE